MLTWIEPGGGRRDMDRPGHLTLRRARRAWGERHDKEREGQQKNKHRPDPGLQTHGTPLTSYARLIASCSGLSTDHYVIERPTWMPRRKSGSPFSSVRALGDNIALAISSCSPGQVRVKTCKALSEHSIPVEPPATDMGSDHRYGGPVPCSDSAHHGRSHVLVPGLLGIGMPGRAFNL